MSKDTSRLSREQIAQYEQEGYVLFHEPVFSPEKFARLREIFEENLERFSAFELDMIHTHDPRLLEFLLSDEVLDLVEPVVGPNIGLWASHLISKPPRTGKATPWHEDSAYWDGRVSTLVGICTVWLAIDESTPENGCMRVIPGSHVNGFSDYEPVDNSKNIFGTQIKPELRPEAQRVQPPRSASHPRCPGKHLGEAACGLHDALLPYHEQSLPRP
jgi:hypothetical protein